MSSAIFACGHWRRRDPLAGLTDVMRDALTLASQSPLYLLDGLYRRDLGEPGVPPSTVTALSVRGLMRVHAGPEGLLRRHILTPAGHRLVAVMRQRAETRARLIADKPARALTPEIAR